MNKVDRIVALDAQVTVVRNTTRLAGHPYDPVKTAIDIEIELTTDPAVTARGADFLQVF